MSSVVAVEHFDAVLFDLDGVLTTTPAVHARRVDADLQWLSRFEWDVLHPTSTTRFDDQSDYAVYVDGKPREAGVRDFLASRGITLAEGGPASPPAEDSI